MADDESPLALQYLLASAFTRPHFCSMEEPESFRQSSRKFARTRRRLMTKSENMLWWELRDHRLGLQFRRQMPIGPYTVDFACHAFRLIVEIDGRTHHDAEAVARDTDRQEWLERMGWRVLRFSDDIVIGGLPLVVEAIRNACRGKGK